MASLWRRAMVYLGLQDDDEFVYDGEYEYDEVETGGRDPREAREIRDPRGSPRELHDPREHGGGEPTLTVRPMARDEAADVSPQRAAVIRTVPASSARVHVLEPQGFNDAQEVGDRLKSNQPVMLDLRGRDRDLQRRLIDFASGLAYALGASMARKNDQVYLLTPSSIEVSQEEKERLQARGLWRD
jgi:cell division inhibitor SepF